MFRSMQVRFALILLTTFEVSSKECKFRKWLGCSSKQRNLSHKSTTLSYTYAKKISMEARGDIKKILKLPNAKEKIQTDKKSQVYEIRTLPLNGGQINRLQLSHRFENVNILEIQQSQRTKRDKRQQHLKQKQILQKSHQQYLVDLQQLQLKLLLEQKQLKKEREEKLVQLQLLLLQKRQLQNEQTQH
ncbi:uncharacterized protein DDB_G0285291-like [Hydractinia symbiolongicarpus]|uniref:uncharacterized protein DDB_G0285291-like n=1 Tax=Hydractinia symbiolongicarpus TaxID=13093 RepID=UPI00254A191A|nr:uncharacterized protein DDB_G0285291-like [Hydractinia symbiolongicarpus]